MRSELLDDFAALSGWMPIASGLAELHISSELGPAGAVMRLDFDFEGGGGFVVARRLMSRVLPESYAFRFSVRGLAPANRFELKLVDPSGHNVWWRYWDAFTFPADWQTLRIRSREIELAWGPAGDRPLSEIGALELVIAAGPGGRGTVWIGALCLAVGQLGGLDDLPRGALERTFDQYLDGFRRRRDGGSTSVCGAKEPGRWCWISLAIFGSH